MPEQFLNGPDVIAVLQQMRRKRVTKHVRTDTLGKPRQARRIRNLSLHRRLVKMKARGWTPLRIATDPRGGKHKLPSPVRGSVGILAIQCKGQYDPPHTVGEIPLMLPSHLPQVSLEPFLDRHRQHRPPVFLAFAPPNDNFMPVKVEVLDSKLQALLQPQSCPIEKGHDHPHRPLDILEDLADFFSAEYDWDPMRQLRPGHLVDCANLDAKHVTIDKQQGAQRLILRR